MPTMEARSVIDSQSAGGDHALCASGIIVCGGQSRRMGSDKAQLEILGRTMLQRAIDWLQPLCSPLLLACGPVERYAEVGLPMVLDSEPNSGPVAGIIAGLEAIPTTHALVVACDMPFLSEAIGSALLERASAERLDVCLLASERGLEPLCGVYSAECASYMRAASAAGRRKVTAFLAEAENELRVGHVELSELMPELDRACLSNVNTREDFDQARDRADRPRGSRRRSQEEGR